MSIRYLDDWRKVPGAIADFNTKNESFVEMAALYKSVGVRNHAFPLALYDAGLSGIDPYSQEVTNDPFLQTRILTETKFNLWYYLREVARIPIDGTPVPVSYKANRANMALSWAFICCIDIVIIMPRQCGKSVGTDTLMLWIVDIAGENTNIHLITKDIQLRVKNIKRLKNQRSKLPPWMVQQSRKDADNTEILTNVKLGNNYLTAVGRSDKIAADNVGRGLTGALLHSDESPYTPNIHISLPVALAAGTDARGNAKKNGTPYCNIFTTTAGKLDTKEGAYCFNIFSEGAWWDEKYLDAKNRSHLAEMMDANMRGERLIFNGTFSHLQIGRTNEWLKEAIVNAPGSKEQIERDFLNKWTSGGVDSPLDVDVLDAISKAAKPAAYTELTKNNHLVKWQYPEHKVVNILMNEHIICSLDTSDAIGRDANGVTFQRAKDMSIIGTSEIKIANNNHFGIWIAEFLVMYPKMMLTFENKQSGQTICDIIASYLMINNINPFVRIYNRIFDDIDNDAWSKDKYLLMNPESIIDDRIYEKYKRYFGFVTTGKSRDVLYNTVFIRAANSCGHYITDETLSKQIRELVEINGRIDHPKGGNDDLVISWLIPHYVAIYGKNLHLYGLPRGLIYSGVVYDATRTGTAHTENIEQRKRMELKSRIELLKQRMEETSSLVAKQAIQIQIKNLLSQVVDVQLRGEIMDDLREGMKERVDDKTTLRQAMERRFGKAA